MLQQTTQKSSTFTWYSFAGRVAAENPQLSLGTEFGDRAPYE